MSIKQNGGVFGRNPTFNDVTIDGELEVTGEILANGGIALGDNDKVTFGTDDDLQISHNGSASLISDTGTGDLYIRSSTALRLQSAANENYLVAVADGAVTIYHDNNPKIETKSTGIEVTGNISLDSGNGIDFSATAGTGTSELFDDYEEGTWSPVYAPQTGSFATMTMEVYDAVYTKIGNTVFISAFMRTDNVDMGTASGTLRITGLPFAPSSVVSTGGVEVSFASAFGGDYPLSGWFESSYIQLSYRTSVNGTSLSSIVTDLTAGATANQNTLRISGMYKTAS
jgi:hypothetical protein